MTAPTPNKKRERSIPIKISVDPRPALTKLPPIPAAELRPKVAVSKPTIRTTIKMSAPIRVAKQPVHEWPEERRRKLMWWLVGGGMTVIIIGWLAIARFETGGSEGFNIFSEAKRIFSTLKLPGSNTSTPAEQEIRQLDTQVFPQFQK